MNLTEYQGLALRTEQTKPYFLGNHQLSRLDHASKGLVSEVGEIVDALKKHIVYGKPLDKVNMLEEVGDVMWYVALAASACKIDMTVLGNYSYRGVGRMDVYLSDLDLSRIDAAANHIGYFVACFNDAISLQNEVPEPPQSDWYRVQDSLGEVVAGCRELAMICNGSLERACELNIAKLAKRYGDKFSEEKALNRDLVAERAVLEAGPATAETSCVRFCAVLESGKRLGPFLTMAEAADAGEKERCGAFYVVPEVTEK